LRGSPAGRDRPTTTFAPSGTLDGSPAEPLEEALTSSADAFAAIDPADAEKPAPLPPFAVPANQAIHAWDIAVATGQPSPLTPSLARALRPVADVLVEPLRGFAYGRGRTGISLVAGLTGLRKRRRALVIEPAP
jgi:hypothetical protein